MVDLVSIIIPCFNQSHFLPSAVRSCLQQTYPNNEIIVIDDGSHDDVSEVLKPFKGRIKLIVQNNCGLPSARNAGLYHSKGEFIQLLDADDMLGPDSINSHLRFLKKHPNVSISVCRNRLFKKNNSKGEPKSTGQWHLFRSSLAVHLCHLNIAPPHAFFLRRKAVVQTGQFDPSLKACEDWEYWLRAATKGFSFAYNPKGVVYYRRHPDSMSAKASRQLYFDSILHRRIFEFLDQFSEFPEGNRLEGLMAFCAGTVYTAGKLKIYHPHLEDDMMNFVLKKIREARELALCRPHKWNSLIKLNYIRLVSCLIHPFFCNSEISVEILGNLNQILASLQPPIKRPSLIRDVAFSSFIDSTTCAVERQIQRGLICRFLKNNFKGVINRLRMDKTVKTLSI